MTRHVLDKDGDYCRLLHWEDNGEQKGNRLNVCGKPGYPYCELHSELVRQAREARLRGDAGWLARVEASRRASWQNHILAGSR